ncbi:glycosyltransferase family 9 protein [Marinomonas sp.]
MPEEKPLRIMIVRLSALGDVCHAMAVVQAIMQRHPNAQVTWLTSPLEAKLVRLLPGVEVIEYDKRTGFKGMFAIKRTLRERYFDILLHLQWSLRASVLTRMVKAGRRVGFARAQSREKQHWFVNELAPLARGEHVLDSFMAQASVLDVSQPSLPCELNLPPLSEELSMPYVVINPSASKAERNWTVAGYQAVLDYLNEKGITVVLTGGPSEQEQQFAQQIIPKGKSGGVINLVGKTSLDKMLSVLKQAQLVVAPDTGPAHMATLVGTPVLGLYAHSNPARTGPYNNLDQVVSVYQELAEKEYQKSVAELPWSARVHDPKAMQSIQIEAVLARLDTML